MIRTALLNPLIRHATAYAASAAVQKSVGFVLLLWLAHSLPVADYATFGLLFALQTGLAGMAGAGIVETVTGLLKDHRTEPERLRLFAAANTVFLLLSGICAVVVALASNALQEHAHAAGVNLASVAAAGIASAFFTLQAHLTRLEERHEASLALGFVPPLAGWVIATAAFAFGRSVSWFFAGLACGFLLCLLPFSLREIGYFRLAGGRIEAGSILARIGPFVAIVVLAWLSGYGNTYLVNALFTAEDVARFTFAYTLASIMQLTATSLNQVWGPRFLRIVYDSPVAVVESSNQRFFLLQGCVLGVVGGIVLVIAPSAIAWGGTRLAAYQGLNAGLLLLFAGYAISIPWYHVQNYYFAYAKGRELLFVTLATTTVGVLVWLAAMWLLGSTGIYVGFLALTAIRTIGSVVWARREWHVRLLWQGPVVAIILLGTASLVSAWLTHAPSAPETHAWAEIGY